MAASIPTRSLELEPTLTETSQPVEHIRKGGPMVVMPAKTETRLPTDQPVDKKIGEEPIEWIFSQDTVATPASGGYLTRPANIYNEEPSESLSDEINLKDQKIFTAIAKNTVQDDNPPADMQLVFKDEIPAADVPRAHQTQPVSMADQPAEEPAMQDEAEGLRRRAAERINKLRNLSFNMNAADPNNEFETVPAYIRRNLELYNTVTSVESFYSQYEVKAENNKKGEISTINSFLDGKKPD
jgi:cell division protein FtsZ